MQPVTDGLAGFVAGFVAAEGTFTGWSDSTKRVFRFAVGLGATDRGSCELLHAFFGVGHIWTFPAAQAALRR